MADKQSTHSGWTMSQERVFLENALTARFTVFIVFFALVIAGALVAASPGHFKIVLCLGTVISVPLALSVAHTQTQLDLVLDELVHEKGHPLRLIDRRFRGQPVRQWIGYWIPLVCCFVLAVGAVLALAGALAPHTGGP
jgi:hypothetical protein